MTKLGERNEALLSMGAKTLGDWVDAYSYCEEELYSNEAETIYAFCKWMKKTGKGFGWGNSEEIFAEFLEDNKNGGLK